MCATRGPDGLRPARVRSSRARAARTFGSRDCRARRRAQHASLLGLSRSERRAQLAGLPAAYQLAQLNALADGTRADPVMTPLARGMSVQVRAQLASYYAGL